jgi:hypothetical protein
MLAAILGIEDGYVLAAYLLCIGSAVLCVLYGLITWNKGQEPVEKEDFEWAAEERKVEEEL